MLQALAEAAPSETLATLRGPLEAALAAGMPQDADRARTCAAAEALAGLLACAGTYAAGVTSTFWWPVLLWPGDSNLVLASMCLHCRPRERHHLCIHGIGAAVGTRAGVEKLLSSSSSLGRCLR